MLARMLAVTTGLAAAGCGGGGGTSDNVVIITLGSLTESERQEFEAWKLRPFKSCAWHEAFPALAQVYPDQNELPYMAGVPKVDVKQFLRLIEETSGGYPVLKGADGELIMFDNPTAATSWETNDRTSSRTVNGRGTDFRATSHRDNGECVITLGGEEIFRAFLADRVPAALSYDPKAPASESVKLGQVEEKTDHNVGGSPFVIGRLDGTPLVSGAMSRLAPTASTQAFLAQLFGITPDQAKSFFEPLASNSFQPSSIALLSASAEGTTVNLSKTTYFAPGQSRDVFDSESVQDSSALRVLLKPGTAQLDLFYLPLLGATDKLVRLGVTVAITSPEGTPYAQATTIQLGAGKERSDAAAVDCFLTRYAASAPFSTTVKRYYRSTYDACGVLSPDTAGALASDPKAIAAVMAEFGTYSNTALNYQGWDEALVNLADSMLTREKPLTELDPQIQYAVSTQTADLTSYLNAVPDLETKRALQRKLVILAYDQYFSNRALDETQENDLMAALGKASQPFRESTAQLLSDLVASDRTAGLAAATCGAGLTDERITAIENGIAGAQSYAYGKGFGDRLRRGTLQACYLQADLDGAAAAVSAARAFTSEEAARNHGVNFERYHQALVDHALDQRWTAEVYANATDAISFALVSKYDYCAIYESISEQAWCAAGDVTSGYSGWLSAAAGQALHPSFAGRYAALARDLRERFTSQLTGSVGIPVKIDIETAYFRTEGMWLDCGSDAYAAKRNELFQLLDQLKNASDTMQRVQIEQKIEDLVGSSCSSSVQ